MNRNHAATLVFGCVFLGAFSAQAGVVTIDANFGTGAGVSGFAWPGTSNAGTTTNGVTLTGPIFLDGGAIKITGSAAVECALGVTASTCGTATGLSDTTAYGLGIGNGRIDVGETLTLTVEPGFGITNVELLDFSLTGFTTDGAPGGVAEKAIFSLDGASNQTFTATGSSSATPKTDTPDENFASTLTFGSSAGNYSLASIDLKITSTNTPEPATFGLAGLTLVALGLAGRRFRRG
jgi:hypothetical protein